MLNPGFVALLLFSLALFAAVAVLGEKEVSRSISFLYGIKK